MNTSKVGRTVKYHIPMNIKKLTISIAVSVLSVVANASHAESLKPFRIAHDFWVGYAGMYVAVEKGFFKEAGLKVEEKTFSTPADGLVPLLNGDVDLHLSTIDTFLMAIDHKKNSVKIITLIDSSAGADAV